MEDDLFSTTNVSLLEEVQSPRQLVSSPVPFLKKKNENLENSSQKSDILQSSSNSSEQWNVVEAPHETLTKSANPTMPLKHQENTVDVLKKENFDLRLKIYFLEARLHDLSPVNLDNTLKENVDLKVTVQRLTKEIKKYTKVIHELKAAIEILNKPCPKQHGMTQAEKEELKAAISSAEASHEEIDRQSKMVADISAENVRLRASLRSAKTEHEETDLNRKYRQAQTTIQEQQQQIQTLQSKSGTLKPQDPYLLNKVKALEEQLKAQRMEIDVIMDDKEQKNKAVKDLNRELSEARILLFDNKQLLKAKVAECERLTKGSASSVHSNEDTIDHLKRENQMLITELQNREREVTALEDEIIKLLSYCEGDDLAKPEEDNEKLALLENIIQERDQKIAQLTEEVNNMNKLHDQDMEELEKHIHQIQNEIQEKSDTNNDLIALIKETEDKSAQIQKEYEQKLEKQFNELAVAIRERDVKIATLEGEQEAQEDTVEREKMFLKEEIDDLSHKLDFALQELEEKSRYVLELKEVVDEKQDNSSETRLKEELEKLVHLEEEWRERIRSLEEELAKESEACHTLTYEWERTKEKNGILNKMLKAAETNSKAEQRLQSLNYDLRKKFENQNFVQRTN
ncbi:microtubule associated-domain-containing protein [Sporodiniella umbellata]|nr:microtubule associated-domain-containing protein [Sporodiniella umbellata]